MRTGINKLLIWRRNNVSQNWALRKMEFTEKDVVFWISTATVVARNRWKALYPTRGGRL